MEYKKYFRNLEEEEEKDNKYIILSTVIYEIIELLLYNKQIDLKEFSISYLKNSINYIFIEDLIKEYIEKNEFLNNEFNNIEKEFLINIIGILIIEILFNLINKKKINYKEFILKNILSYEITKNI